MEESNVVFLDDHRVINPVLGRGDLVRMLDSDLDGIVVGVTAIFGPDSGAPGQAAAVDVAVAYEEDWQVFEDVPIHELHRIISREHQIARGVDTETG
tara:strand:+ start:1488 stop:1778 length:291 start_codon:yes stop_codon:yes gene_type:complete